MSTFNGQCLCGDLDASLRMAELIIESQTKYNVTQSLVHVWHTEYDDYDRPTEVFDMCISFENACQHFLDRIDCPADQQKVVGCDRKSILEYKGDCECGDRDYSSTRIAELIIDTSLYRRYDLIPYGGYPSLQPINYWRWPISDVRVFDLDSETVIFTQWQSIDTRGKAPPRGYYTGVCKYSNDGKWYIAVYGGIGK